MPQKINELRDSYSFIRFEESEIHKSMKLYCHFVFKAKVYENEGRAAEAFLHYVIALDLLFGEKDSSTRKISQRVAVVVFNAFGESFPTLERRMRKIYGRRSKYVHKGELISPKDIELVQPISQEVFRCLLRLQARTDSKVEGFFQKWLSDLDYFVGAMEAGREIASMELAHAGIALRTKAADIFISE